MRAASAGTGERPSLPRESVPRLLAKTIEWRITGTLLGVLIGYALTQSWAIGAAFGGIYNAVRLVVMPLRDWLWDRVAWGLLPPKPP